jgi:FlaA1/EpsC-like NDP-sugar epimerase
MHVIITGGTGTFGRQATKELLLRENVNVITIASRDEYKQSEMRKEFENNKKIRFLTCDVGNKDDTDRLLKSCRIMSQHDSIMVLHAAAMKRIETVRENALAAIRTNVKGTENCLLSFLHNNRMGDRFTFISSDKAVDPVNLYGVTKLMAEKICLSNHSYDYSGHHGSVTKPDSIGINIVRYGNVINSRGSLVEYIKKAIDKNFKINVTSKNCTRYFIPIETAVRLALFVSFGTSLRCIFVPEMNSINISTLLDGYGVLGEETFLSQDEKTHESILSKYETDRVIESFRSEYVGTNVFKVYNSSDQKETYKKAISPDVETKLLTSEASTINFYKFKELYGKYFS